MAWDSELDQNTETYKIAASKAFRLRIIAGPGTGKSFAMKRRVARILETTDIDPKHILAVTFTRVAAEDLHRELIQLGVEGSDQLKGRTLHSLGLSILIRKHVLEAIGREARLLNDFEEESLLFDLADAYGGKRRAGKLLDAYVAAWAKSQGEEPGFAEGEEKAFAKDTLAWLSFHRGMLRGEIVPYLLLYLKHNPGAPERTEFKSVLVDEYQDLNKAEQQIISYMSEKSETCIVGDDDQSIYSFKFAHPDGIREWPGANVELADHKLTECRRCPTTIVEMANSLISHNKNREERDLVRIEKNGAGEVEILQFHQIEDEVAWIAKKIKSLVDAKAAAPGDIIVLVQRSVIGKQILSALRELEVPTKSYYEESQLDSEEAQLRFALFKFLLNPDDRVALRYLLGVGSANMRAPAYAKLRAHCEKSGLSPRETLELLHQAKISISHVGNLVKCYTELMVQVDGLKQQIADLPSLVDALFPEGDDSISELRLLALECLENESAPSNAEELLEAMMDIITQPEVPPAIDDVRLMSLHKSKGLSVPYVFIAGCVQGLLPKLPDANLPEVEKEANLEEQRRLFFVGITRVKAQLENKHPGALYLTYCQQTGIGLAKQAGIQPAYAGGGVATLQPSQFLNELGKSAPKPKAG